MKNDLPDLRGLRRLQPVELAARLERLPVAAASDAFRQLTASECAAVLLEMDASDAVPLLADLPIDQVLACLRLLPPHVTADLASAIPVERRDHLLAGLPPDTSQAVTALLRYPADSAGGAMDNRFIAMPAEETVERSLARLRGSAPQRDDGVAYIYIIDGAQRLVGVVSLRDLVFGPADERLRDIMNPNVVSLRVHDDQEEIARKMQRYHFLAFPVVDENGQLVGVVKTRDVLRIAQSEATEDMQLMVGLSGEERIWTPWRNSIRRRLPWLGVNLGTASGAAVVASFFEGTIARWTAVVAFLPLICAVAGNAGNQALTVIIRSLALGEVAAGDPLRALRKELFIGAANGVALACAIGMIAFAWKGSGSLAAVAGAAMLLNQMIGALAGVAIPFALKWCKIDPALASSILVTALTDTIGFLVFLGLAALAVHAYGT